MKLARPRCCASATMATARSAVRADRAGTGRSAATDLTEPNAARGPNGGIVPIVRRAARAMKRILESTDGRRAPPPVFPPSQVVPVFGRQRAEDRLQGHAPLVALYFRARQDRALAHYGGERRQATRTRAGDQARPVPGPSAVRDSLMTFGRRRRS